jgi:hypothetical protein
VEVVTVQHQLLLFLNFTSTTTRTDIAYSVGIANRFMEAPGIQHWAVVKQILRYLKGTQNYGCRYTEERGSPVITGYSDSYLAGDVDDHKSTSGMVFFMGGSWLVQV